MNEFKRTEKITVGNILTRLLQGSVLGLTSMIPFFQVKDLKETLSLKEKIFQKDTKSDHRLKDILTESLTLSQNRHLSFFKTLLWYITHRWSYMIGFLIGFLVFFFIPVNRLTEEFSFAVYGGMMALSGGFLFYELNKALKNRYSHKELLSTLLFFLSGVILPWLTTILFDHLAIEVIPDTTHGLILLAILFVASFILSYTGMSLGTMFYLTSTFKGYSVIFNTFLYEHTDYIFILYAVIGILLGYTLSVFVKRFFGALRQEGSSFNAGVYIFSLFYIGFVELKQCALIDTVSELSQQITIGTTIAGCFLIALMLTIHGFAIFNQKDYRQLNNLSDAEVAKK